MGIFAARQRGALDHLPESEEDPGRAKSRPLSLERLAEYSAGLIALTGGGANRREALRPLRDIFGAGQLFIELVSHGLPGDDRRRAKWRHLADAADIPVVATGNAYYAGAAESRLRDALIAIRHNLSLTDARKAGLLPGNSQFALRSPAEMAQRFAEIPEAIQNTTRIAALPGVAGFFRLASATFSDAGGIQ
ncbi:MAG: hypothetical protein R2932_24095 [Caldilineaceae bacterium]